MTSGQSSELELVTIDQAKQIVRAHLVGHSQSAVKSVNQIENTGYRQVHLDVGLVGCPRAMTCSSVIPLAIGPISWI